MLVTDRSMRQQGSAGRLAGFAGPGPGATIVLPLSENANETAAMIRRSIFIGVAISVSTNIALRLIDKLFETRGSRT
jgi:hypothetical protein